MDLLTHLENVEPEERPGLSEQLAEYIRDNVIGASETFLGPFGRRKLVYADYIASGRSLKFIEDFIIAEVNNWEEQKACTYKVGPKIPTWV